MANGEDKLFSIETLSTGEGASRVSTALFFIICALPVLTTILFGGVDNTTWIIIVALWGAMLLLWLGESRRLGGLVYAPSPLILPLAALAILATVQLLPVWQPYELGPLGEATRSAISLEPYATRFFLVRLVVYTGFFAAALSFINSDKRVGRAVFVLTALGTVMAFFGILQKLADPDSIYGMRNAAQARPFGPYINQHHFASLMQMTSGAALGMLFGRDIGREKRAMSAVAAGLMGVAAVFTGSRGGLLGLTAVFTVAAVLTYKYSRGHEMETGRWSKLVLAVPAVLLIGIFAALILLGGGESLIRGVGLGEISGDISSGRTTFWPIAIKIFLAHPILGAGFDAFGVAFTRYDTTSGVFRVEQAHNDYLQTLADGGILAFACIAAFIWLLISRSLAVIKTTASSARRSAAIGALAGCCGILVHSFFDFPLRTPSNAFVFLVLVSIATVDVSGRRRSRKQTT